MGYTKVMEGSADLAAAQQKVTAALKKQGFGVVTEFDVQAIVERKLNKISKPYVILGACPPKMAQAILARDPYVGLLLPCNIIIFEDERGRIMVSFAKPNVLFELIKDPILTELAKTVDDMIGNAFRSL